MTNVYETKVFQSFLITKAESLLARLELTVEHVAFGKSCWIPPKKLQFPRNNPLI